MIPGTNCLAATATLSLQQILCVVHAHVLIPVSELVHAYLCVYCHHLRGPIIKVGRCCDTDLQTIPCVLYDTSMLRSS